MTKPSGLPGTEPNAGRNCGSEATSARGIDLSGPPTAVLAQIQELFRRWGLFGQPLQLTHEGIDYQVSCTPQAFIVYRLLASQAAGPGAPGWPVCLVSAHLISDECSPPHSEADALASHLALPDWVEIIYQYFEPVTMEPAPPPAS